MTSIAATEQIASGSVVYTVSVQLTETGGQTGATVNSIAFIFLTDFSRGSSVQALPAPVRLPSGGSASLGPFSIPDTADVVATQLSATASFQDDTGHRGSASGFTTLPTLMFGLTGIVQDSATGAVLPGAFVSVTSGPDAADLTQTDSAGHYAFGNLQAGTFTVQAEDAGYTTLSQSVTLTANGQSNFPLVLATSTSSSLHARTTRPAARATPGHRP
jgi:hypothetical protein